MIRLVLVLAAFAALVGAAATSAQAADRYAGITRGQAVEKAADGVISLAIAFNGTSPKQAAKLRLKLEQVHPRTAKSRCKGIKAWKVVWPDSDPIWVNRGGLVMACYITTG